MTIDHPQEWSDALIRLFNGGGWVVPALAAWWIFWRYNPWKKGGNA